MSSTTEEKLRGCLCCCGDDDHTVGQGGRHINIVMLKKLARWPYLTAVNVLFPKSYDYPLASAVVCDRCMKEKREIKYAMAGIEGDDEPQYYRVPLTELEEPEYYWPEHHPAVSGGERL